MDERAKAEAAALREAVVAFTSRATASDAADDELAASEWTLLRALADFREALASPDSPEVLGWVPPVEELDDEGVPATDKVMQVATWFFSVADSDQVLVAGRERVAVAAAVASGVEAVPVRTVSDVVGMLAESEIDWPDVDAYESMGLSVDSAHFFTQVLHPER